MSHFVFGDFSSMQFETEQINTFKAYSEKKDIYYWFNQEIDFCNDIHSMIKEHKKPENSIKFCITTYLQKTNSEDLLLPYDKYNSKMLFPNGEERTEFNNYCKINLDIFYDTFLYFLKVFNPKELRVFITEGYDCDFKIKKCTDRTMIQDILNQVRISFILDSVIYELG